MSSNDLHSALYKALRTLEDAGVHTLLFSTGDRSWRCELSFKMDTGRDEKEVVVAASATDPYPLIAIKGAAANLRFAIIRAVDVDKYLKEILA